MLKVDDWLLLLSFCIEDFDFIDFVVKKSDNLLHFRLALLVVVAFASALLKVPHKDVVKLIYVHFKLLHVSS